MLAVGHAKITIGGHTFRIPVEWKVLIETANWCSVAELKISLTERQLTLPKLIL